MSFKGSPVSDSREPSASRPIGLDEFRTLAADFMCDREFHRIACGFELVEDLDISRQGATVVDGNGLR
jgi:hypothetical protein